MSECESLCPFLEGLGVPRAALFAVCPIVDNMRTTLKISCPESGMLEIVDKTKIGGRNVTRIATDGGELQCHTRGRKKPYMLSASVASDGSSTLTCRLVSRGPGWYTRQERFVSDDGKTLVERHVLQRPEHDDVSVERRFSRISEDEARPASST